MRIYFKDGMTVIDTESMGGHESKYGHRGLSYSPKYGFFTAYMIYKNHQYYLGCSKDVKEAIAIRKEAERQRENGSFLKWYHTTIKIRTKRGKTK